MILFKTKIVHFAALIKKLYSLPIKSSSSPRRPEGDMQCSKLFTIGERRRLTLVLCDSTMYKDSIMFTTKPSSVGNQILGLLILTKYTSLLLITNLRFPL